MASEQPQASPPGVSVSIIIPSYNTAHLIAACLDSVFAQTFEDFEAIVVNDGSPDTADLEKVLQAYLDRNSDCNPGRLVYIKQVNKRAAGARNTAIAKARGEFLAFLDSDDTWLPNHLESQMKQFQADPALCLAYANAVMVGDPARHVEFMTRCPSQGEAGFEALVVERCQIPVSTVVARKSAIVKAGGFDETLTRCDDYNMWLRTAFLEKADQNLPLTPAQHDLVRGRAAEIHARYLLEDGKVLLSARDFPKARERFSEANQYLHRAKLSLVLFGLKVAPNATSRLYSFWTQRHSGAPA
jgi:glycosyltransferase involved in cell wall biosynthesis